MTSAASSHGMQLVCRVHALRCALPLECVIETMRPLPIEPVVGGPAFVLGVAIVRGAPVPVVDAALLVAGEGGRCSRFVTLRVGERRLALAVDEVIGVASLPRSVLGSLPSLFGDARGGVVSAMGALDRDLLVLLEAARILPEAAWAALLSERASA